MVIEVRNLKQNRRVTSVLALSAVAEPDLRRVFGNDRCTLRSFGGQKREPPGAVLRYDGRLTPSACFHIVKARLA